jgi:hypothetical protein
MLRLEVQIAAQYVIQENLLSNVPASQTDRALTDPELRQALVQHLDGLSFTANELLAGRSSASIAVAVHLRVLIAGQGQGFELLRRAIEILGPCNISTFIPTDLSGVTMSGSDRCDLDGAPVQVVGAAGTLVAGSAWPDGSIGHWFKRACIRSGSEEVSWSQFVRVYRNKYSAHLDSDVPLQMDEFRTLERTFALGNDVFERQLCIAASAVVNEGKYVAQQLGCTVDHIVDVDIPHDQRGSLVTFR